MMPAGKYWIGDLCYVMHDEWSEFCDQLEPGEHTLKDGRRYAWCGTAHGDGCYPASDGSRLGVDAGLIGCILVKDIDLTNVANGLEDGTIVEFTKPFELTYDDGTIRFGNELVVETGFGDCDY